MQDFRPDANRIKNLASGAMSFNRGNDIETMTFGPPGGSKGGFGGGFAGWGKGSGTRYAGAAW